MKIVEIQRFPIRMSPVKIGYRAEDELSEIARVETVIIRVKTDSRVVGFGEAGSIASYLNQTMGGLLDWLHARAATPPSVDEALGIINEICRGVQAIHDAGAIHRPTQRGFDSEPRYDHDRLRRRR